jgi:uncharacterized protein DUF1572
MAFHMIDATYLTDIRRAFTNYRTLAERAVDQVGDDQLSMAIDSEANSIAVLMQHLAGNLRSRFLDFLTADGEKSDRNRDAEFEPPGVPRAQLLARWNEAWGITLGSLDALTPDDLSRTIHIRGEAFAVVEALNRSVTHTAYHVGQIVFLAKHLAGPAWRSLSIPKGRSAEHGVGSFKSGIIPPRR